MKFIIKAGQNVLLFFALILSASFLFAWQTAADLQTKNDTVSSDETGRTVGIKVPESRVKHINFGESRKLPAAGNASGSQPVAVVSADFDSDGYTDLVTSDSNGGLQLFSGIDPANFVIDPKGEKRVEPEPFSAMAIETSLGISPDLMFAGDFNADGKQDIVAASKGSRSLVLLSGNGGGQFAAPQSIAVDGNIATAEAGEIGRSDGQTDLVLAVTNEKGSFLLVYEHPESAFKNMPEVIRLPASVTAIAVGNTDEDFYSDIAVACGRDLVIVHERGQAYPWDIVKGSGITRPPAVVDVRKMAFSIASMAIGRFSEKRGTSLAILGSDGNIHHLEAPQGVVSPGTKLAPAMAAELKADAFEPADSNGRQMAMISQDPTVVREVDVFGKPTGTSEEHKDPAQKFEQELSKAETLKFDVEEVTRRKIEDAPRKAAMQQRAKDAFLRGISAKATRLESWEVRQITTDRRFVAMAANGAKLTAAAVSDSPFNDLIVTSTSGEQLEFVSRFRDENGRSKVENTVVEGNGAVISILPTRLNLDGLTDLVVLRQGISSPEVTMTAPAAVFWVNTADDDGDCNFGGSCSLRDAIRRANLVGGSSTIGFENSVLPLTITPSSPLPALVQPINIYGNHLPDGTKLVEISGVNAGSSVDGLKIRTSNAFIYDLAITGFNSQTINGSQVGGNGIAIESDSAHPNNAGNTVLQCYLGINVTGTTAAKNFATGLLIFDSDNNDVSGNTISGNSTGIAVTGGNSNNIANNIIGLNAAGTAKVGNVNGMFLAGANNKVGGDYAGAPNTISGNGVVSNFAPCIGSGIQVPILVDATTYDLLTHDNEILGNRIGTDPTGGVGLGNCWQGINVHPLTGTTIGSITESGRNIISGNGLGGVWCDALEYSTPTEGGFCSIMGNNVGTDITGSFSIYNDAHNTPPISGPQSAVLAGTNLSLSAVGAPGGTTPGGPCTGFCNLVSGNSGGFDLASGVEIGGPGIAGIFNNYIGTKRNGTEPLGNGGAGIDLASTIVQGASPTYFAGGYTTNDGSLGNLVSGNSTFNTGIVANSNGGPGDYHILGNLVGTDVSGTISLPNGHGVQIINSYANTVEIGDSDPLGRNIIAGNSHDGVSIFGGFGVKIVNNAIGVNSLLQPLGNVGNGINIGGFSTYSTLVGGTDPATSNIIANNGKVGVRVNGSAMFSSIRGNTINNNGGLAIDLSQSNIFNDPDGVTINDYCSQDADTGANALQNYPELMAPTFEMDGTANVEGILKSFTHGTFEIDFYSNSMPDPSGHGEGQIYLGSVTTTTNGNGFASFTFHSTTVVAPSAAISATATDEVGNTSEFSCNAGASCSLLAGSTSIDDFLASPDGETCPGALVVNLVGDESDGTLADGVCDINTSNNDPHECTLRAALQIVMDPNNVQFRKIDFDIPGPGVHTITTAGLPAITKYVNIDGESQPGYVNKPLIEIRGSGVTAGTGLAIRTTGATVKGLALNNFFDHAIHIDGGSDNRIQACFIGVAADGTTPGPDLQTSSGIFIQNSHDNTIGGGDAGARNIISHVFYGIYISGGRQNNLLNNFVGTNSTGQSAIGNNIGVLINGSNDNLIGKKLDVDGNVISGNVEGIKINSGSSNNSIQGNYIGTNAAGMAALGNIKNGIVLESGATNNKIGSGLGPFARNIISGQTFFVESDGIRLDVDAGPRNTVKGNFIGLNKDGSAKLPNNFGIAVLADKQTVGANGVYPNVISGNNESGIIVTAPPGSPNQIVEDTIINGNIVGTNFDKTSTTLGNPKLGIAMQGNVKKTTVSENTIGGNGIGVYVGGTETSVGPSENSFKNNGVGITVRTTVATPLPNYVGMIFRGASNNTLTENTVSANHVFGIVLGAAVDDAVDQPPPNANQLTTQNKLIDNRIGTDDTGYNAFGNGKIGLVVGDFANNNCIGSCTGVGNTGGYGNVISSHDSPLGVGILLGSLSTTAPPQDWPSGNQFRDNTVGMNRDLSDCLPNRIGMLITKAGANQVGVRVGNFKHGNVFTCNNYQGISIEGETNGDMILESNFVGVTPMGQNFPNNQSGGIGIFYTTDTKKVWIKDTVIGGQKYGVYAVQTTHNRPETNLGSEPLPPIVLVSNSLIGVFRNDDNTLTKVGNEIGILAENATRVVIGRLIADGMGQSVPKNIISGNAGPGIKIMGSQSAGNVINNTIIGTDETGASGLGNEGPGVLINNAAATILGSLDAANLNSIAGNDGPGVMIQGATATMNRILNNRIGIAPNGDSVGNTGDGVLISEDAKLNEVGGPGPDDGNTIANNGGAGVRVDETAGHCNLVDPNSIYGNSGLGIDIGPLGHTPNDPDDEDEGANRGQNYPDIVGVEIVSDELLVQFKVESSPSYAAYGSNGLYVEFFKSDSSGEGQSFLGSTYYTEANYNASLAGVTYVNLGNVNLLGFGPADRITATATDFYHNTSEFAPVLAPTAAGVSVSGRVMRSATQGLGNANLTLVGDDGRSRKVITNGFGYYRFDDVEAGRTYILTISHKQFEFVNPSRVIMLVDELTDVDFMASP